MKTVKIKGQVVVDLTDADLEFENVELLVDYLAMCRFKFKSEIFIVRLEMVLAAGQQLDVETCSVLRTKCRNYNCKLIVLGQFEQCNQELADYIYSCNNGKHLFMVNSIDEGLSLLKGVL